MGKRLAIGIDIGGTDIKYGIVEPTGNILEFSSLPTPKTSAEDIIQVITQLIAGKDIQYNTYLAVGIGIPGVYDTGLREVIITPNLASKNYSWHQAIEKASSRRVAMDNDANMAALGEWWQGAGKKIQHLLLLTLGTGVGAGIIIEGKIFQGSSGWAGEIGNTIVFPGGERCVCGKKGCLEAYASASAISRRYSLIKGVNFNTQEVFAAAENGDDIADTVIEEGIEALAIGIYNYCLIFNPQAVLLGGGMVKAGERLLQPLTKKVTEMLLLYPGKANISIKLAEMENKAGVLGAAKVALDINSI